MSDSDRSLHLFLNSFTARDLAEPLASFDEGTALASIEQAMAQRRLTVVGVRRAGTIVGWLAADDLASGAQPWTARPIQPATVIAETASLNEVVDRLSQYQVVFVRTLGEIGGLIRAADFEKAPMRMWLFGLVTITELRVTRLIDQACPHGAWQQYLSPGRLHLAEELRAERRRRHQDPSLLECLQLADKGRIVARDETLRSLTRFPSRRAVEDFVIGLQDLRNNLAHSQDVSGDWEIIRDLATNVHRIVLGPEFEREAPPDGANR